jgi:hypothetical protein
MRPAIATFLAVTLAGALTPPVAANSAGVAWLDGSGGVGINDGDEWTRTASVRVTLPYPTGPQGLVRLSNNGTHWSAPRPWSESVAWSLIDSSAGGTNTDGLKVVQVQWQNPNGSWSVVGQDGIQLDREAPWFVDGMQISGGGDWHVSLIPGERDDNLTAPWDLDQEFSIDGGKSWWGFLSDNPFWMNPGLDMRTQAWGGNWDIGPREACLRLIDRAGNRSAPSCSTIDLRPSVSGKPNIRFELPRKAVTGELYTIRPVFPPGFTVPSTARCRWILRWGDLESIFGLPNETFGQVWIERRPSTGACGEWTFSLPYTPGLWYHWSFAIWDGYTGIYGSPTDRQPAFQATVGTQQRGIPKSTIGLTYILPDKYLTAAGQPVTYTLHASEGYTAPTAAWWWSLNADNSQSFEKWGGKTFTFTPTKEGPYWTGWTYETSTEYLRAEFDPPVDKKPPVVTAPAAAPTPAGTIGDRVPVTLSWTAKDPLLRGGHPGSGVSRSILQVSRNGGAWTKVTLANEKATSVTLNLLATGLYRYRVRAVDRAGNTGLWATGPTFRPRVVQQSAAAIAYGGSWTSASSTSWSGGSARVSSSSGAAATYRFTGRAVAWVADAGTNRGLAQVYVDGKLTTTVDLAKAAAQGHRRITFSRSWATAAEHTVRIVVLGTLTRPQVSVDAFVVLR